MRSNTLFTLLSLLVSVQGSVIAPRQDRSGNGNGTETSISPSDTETGQTTSARSTGISQSATTTYISSVTSSRSSAILSSTSTATKAESKSSQSRAPMTTATAGSDSGSDTSSTSVDVGSGTTDLGWIPTSAIPSPPPLATTDKNVINATKTTSTGGTPTPIAFDDYSDQTLEQFWDDYVGPVQEPPFRITPLPPQPYPLPEDPPTLFPDYLFTCPEKVLTQYQFPEGFLFGWATAAQQWEGAVKDGGKGPTIWDWASRFPGFIADNTTSDVGDLGYYLYKQDIARLSALGGNVYSFSLFWTRIYPFGSKDSPINEEGVQFYRDLINYCWDQGVEPVVTLFHWDTPLALQLKYGGFASEDIIDDYVNYAETVFRQYNGTVHKWITFNEPVVFCSQQTFSGGLNTTVYPYTCSYHLTLAHAKTVQRFRELNIQGQIAFKSDNFFGVPWRDGNQDDIRAVERHGAYQIGIFAEPIYNTGDWPELIKDDLPPEILPRFTDEQKALIKGTADFFAIDGYRVGYVTAPPAGFEACIANISDPLWPACNQVNFYVPTPYEWGPADFADQRVTWLQNTWKYLRSFLKGLLEQYPTSGGIYLTEFGFAEPVEDEQLYKYRVTTDTKRELYFLSYLGEVLKAIHEDGTDVRGTFAWSLVDNVSTFEWNSGFAVRFGVQHVDYNSPTLERTFKRSAIAMSKFWNSHRSG
nr:uncharacterized protein I203_04177 [Kwoniella mangroviensis CBS 8507]OCF66601.1 hypothetical protein I203_04177 [Kwoniella mangroviensis CBS 8507]